LNKLAAETEAFEAGVENVEVGRLEHRAVDVVDVVVGDADEALEIPVADAAGFRLGRRRWKAQIRGLTRSDLGHPRIFA
jgi:hypothetical protein